MRKENKFVSPKFSDKLKGFQTLSDLEKIKIVLNEQGSHISAKKANKKQQKFEYQKRLILLSYKQKDANNATRQTNRQVNGF